MAVIAALATPSTELSITPVLFVLGLVSMTRFFMLSRRGSFRPRIRHSFTQQDIVVNPVLDILGALFLLLGAMLCFAASVGLLRFPDAPTRMHAATKPQTLGLLCAVVGLALSLQNFQVLGLLVLIIILQLATSPVSAHMVGRTAYRTGQIRSDLLFEDDLADDLTAAGFRLSSDENDDDSLDEPPDEPPDGDRPPAAPDARPPTTDPGPKAGDSEP